MAINFLTSVCSNARFVNLILVLLASQFDRLPLLIVSAFSVKSGLDTDELSLLTGALFNGGKLNADNETSDVNGTLCFC